MPIYRGTQRVTPRPGGQSVARVYRGDRPVWQAAPPSIYPVSGSWGPTNVPTAPTTFDSHVIEEAGEYTITHTATSSGSPISFMAGIRTPHGITNGGSVSPSTITITEQFQPGDLIEFRALSINASISSGTWSITKH